MRCSYLWRTPCLVLLCCVVLAGLVMPDTPRPRRHARAQLDSYAGQAQGRVQRNQPAPSNPGAEAVKREAATRKPVRQADRSARIVLPSQRLR